MKKITIKLFSIILCAGMIFLSACSTQSNERTGNENDNSLTNEGTSNENNSSLTNAEQTESSSRIEFKSFSDEEIAFENNTAFVNSQLLMTVDKKYTYDDVNNQVEQLNGKIVGCIEFTNDYQVEFENADYNKLSDIQKQLSDYFDNSSVKLHKVLLLNEEANEDSVQYSNNGNWWREAVKLTDLEKESHTYQSVNVGVFDTVFDVSNQDLAYAFQNGDAINNETEKLNEKYGHHGTNVSGFLAAQKNNNYGIDGTANNVNLFAYSYFGSGDKFTHFTSIMEYKYRIATLLSKNAKIINISLGNNEITVAAQNEIQDALSDLKYYSDSLNVFLKKYIDLGQEFVIIKSAGNDNGYTWIKCDVSSDHPYGIRAFDKDKDKDLNKFTQLDNITYDAKYDIMGTITDSSVKNRIIIVGSSDKTNNRANHSVNGERVDIYAPGIELKTILDGENGEGTSYAAPITAGVVALMWGVNPDIKADYIKYLLTSSATVPIENEKYQIDADSGNIIYMNKYLVNAQNAVKRAEVYKTEKIPSANNNEGVLMGITRLYDNGNLSDFKDKCTISIYKSDTDDVPFKTITTDQYGEFFINLSAGDYTLEAESSDGVYRSERLGFNIESSAVKYMDYVLVSKNTEKMYAAYLKELKSLIDKYGNGKVVDGSSGNGLYKMTGLSYAKLIDFDKDGNEELLCVYGPTKDGDGYEKPYYMKVFGYNGKEIITLFEYNVFSFTFESGLEFIYKIAYCEENGQTLLLTKKNPMTYVVFEWSKLTKNKFETVKSITEDYESDPGNSKFKIDNEYVSREEFNKQLTEWKNKQTYIIFNSNSKSDLENNINETNNTLKILGYDVQENTSQQVQSTSAKWKQAYIDYINEYDKNIDTVTGKYIESYKLVDINGDEIPELYINYGFTAAGDELCSYYDGKIIKQWMSISGFSYIEGQNIFCDSGGHMGSYHDKVYTMENGTFKLLCDGEYGEKRNPDIQRDENGHIIFFYKFNDVDVSHQEYKKSLENVYDKNKAYIIANNVTYNSANHRYEGDGIYYYDDIIEVINNY